MKSNVLLGELLIEKKMITEEQLSLCLSEQRKTKEPLGSILVREGFITEENLYSVLSDQLGVAFVPEKELIPKSDQRLKEILSADFAVKYQVLPLEKKDRTLKIAVGMVPDIIFLDNLRKMTGLDIVVVLSPTSELQRAINAYYGTTGFQEVVSSSDVDRATQDMVMGEDIDEDVNLENAVAEAKKGPVVRLVDMLIRQALDDRASDIHIEPFKNKISVRCRIDGVLYELPSPPKELCAALVSRIKILSKMNIAEKRIPQDGAFSLEYHAKKVDIRVSTIPVTSGEKIVMRILDKRTDLLSLSALGFEVQQQKVFEKVLERPYGLILVTGPTGSGKSTTLYAALNHCLSPKINIVTIEDPVEYQIQGVNQVQVKPEIGMTFAAGLRAFLRQDPDVILVGEIRDLETAEICIRSALTGHMVLSTIHTNDAATAVIRLVDIGIEPYLVAGSVGLIVAQRLVRTLCPDCKEAYTPDARDREKYGITVPQIYRAKGCEKCKNIGYQGRMAIYELLEIDDELRKMIVKNSDVEQIREDQRRKGFQSLFQNGLMKINQGHTTLEEVMSVAYE